MGLTRPRAAQIYNLDYKQATRVVTVSNVTLAGGAPSQVDGVNLSVNDRVLVTSQTTGSENGIYYVATLGSGSNGTWYRGTDANDTGEIDAGTIVMVTEGIIYADTQWKLITDNPIIIGTTTLTFTQNYSANSISGGSSNVTVYSNANVTISSAGTPNVLVIGPNTVTATANLIPSANVTYSLGNTTNRWKDLWIANSTIYIGNVVVGATSTQLTVNNNAVLTATNGNSLSLTGNITGGNILTTGIISATGNITGGNIGVSNLTGANISVTGSVTAASLVGNLVNGTSNIVIAPSGNITANVNGLVALSITANRVSVGSQAGQTNQGVGAIAIGGSSAVNNQGNNAVSIGQSSGTNGQGANAVAIGGSAGSTGQQGSAVAIGYQAALNNQNVSAVAIGPSAGYSGQGANSVAIGASAGLSAQAANSIAIGTSAASNSQGPNAIAMGLSAASASQGANAVAIGLNAAVSNQGAGAITIGALSGNNQGANSIAIGSNGVANGQLATSIVINASGNAITANNSGLYIKPIRNDISNIANVVTYNASTNEVTYTNTISLSGNITSGNVLTGGIISATGNITGPNVAIDRGTAPDNWDTLINMGTYSVDRTSWSGMTGAPVDSTVYVGLLLVLTSGSTTTQTFYPGTVTANNVKIQWDRTLYSGTWTSWYKIINDFQVVDAGSY